MFVSVDIEASGPYPGEYSMLSIGACLVDVPGETFQCELKPLSMNADPKALAVSGLSMEDLALRGLDPEAAMSQFASWACGHASISGAEPVFVGLNAAFDWAFVNHYFLRFLQKNPFGFAPLDIKAFYMGAASCDWADARSSVMSERLGARLKGDHNALHDAIFQAELFRLARNLGSVQHL